MNGKYLVAEGSLTQYSIYYVKQYMETEPSELSETRSYSVFWLLNSRELFHYFVKKRL